jgi:pyruvate dehydrogenase E2 component (dihydrolipoamide acetyltransferase)
VAPAPVGAARKRISPAARKCAEALGVDIAAVLGSGQGDAVTLADVERAAAAGKAAPPAAAPVAPPASAADRQAETRRAIAAAMSRSKREIPHYYLFETIPLARAQQWLTQANEDRPITERLLMAVLQLKAVALALTKYPELNGFFRDGRFEPAQGVHVGAAISLRQGGLIAPALHDVDRKPLDGLMRELTDLVKRTRAGSLRSSEMSDPTVTVTNLGEQGVDAVMGVIYPPQVALVGFGRVARRPWVQEAGGELCVMPTVTASLAADHRVSDGHRGALFLAELRERLQQPQDL